MLPESDEISLIFKFLWDEENRLHNQMIQAENTARLKDSGSHELFKLLVATHDYEFFRDFSKSLYLYLEYFYHIAGD